MITPIAATRARSERLHHWSDIVVGVIAAAITVAVPIARGTVPIARGTVPIARVRGAARQRDTDGLV